MVGMDAWWKPLILQNPGLVDACVDTRRDITAHGDHRQNKTTFIEY